MSQVLVIIKRTFEKKNKNYDIGYMFVFTLEHVEREFTAR